MNRLDRLQLTERREILPFQLLSGEIPVADAARTAAEVC